MTNWNYWDGKIIKSSDGKYHLFASRWAQARGHNGWFGSQAVHAVSDNLIGPYVDKGLCWPTNGGGRALAILRPPGSTGKLTLRAEADGLSAGQVTINVK
jgi:hypothetical protein